MDEVQEQQAAAPEALAETPVTSAPAVTAPETAPVAEATPVAADAPADAAASPDVAAAPEEEVPEGPSPEGVPPVNLIPTELADALQERREHAVDVLGQGGFKDSEEPALYPCPDDVVAATSWWSQLADNAAAYLIIVARIEDSDSPERQAERDHIIEVIGRHGWTHDAAA